MPDDDRYDLVIWSSGDTMPGDMTRLTKWVPFDRRLGIRDEAWERLRVEGKPCAVMLRVEERRYAIFWVPPAPRPG